MEHCRLAGLMDFDNTDPEGAVAGALYQWAGFLVNASGADGLRVDTTPYVFPAFWQRFEAAAAVYAVGEVDSGDLGFVAPYQGAALSGILSYPLFYTLRSVFQGGGSMRQLGSAWRAGLAAWRDPGLLGVFTDNHDKARFRHGSSDVGLFRGALAYSLLSDGIPIVYYGDEWLLGGGGDPACREALWEGGRSYSAQAAPLGGFLAALNAHRRAGAVWEAPQVERWQDDSFYAFSRGNGTLAVFTNAGSGGGVQARDVTYLPEAWGAGTVLCDALDCRSCVEVAAGPVVRVGVAGSSGVAVFSPLVARC
jgi:alpha-amylase